MRSGPLVVSVADLLRRPGTQREVRATAELDGLAISSTAVVHGAPVELDVVLESLSEAVVVTGTVRVTWTGECRRCLREVAGLATLDVREVYEPDPVEGDTYRLAGEQLDLEPMVRDAVLLALPLAPVCDDACEGPAPDDYPVSAREDAPVDPRWAALGDLSFEPE
jgi:uncharacterized protein